MNDNKIFWLPRGMERLAGDFYNPISALSHMTVEKFILFSMGARSIGKTTGYSALFLLDFLDTHGRFVLLRDTQDALNLAAPQFLTDGWALIQENREWLEKDYGYNFYFDDITYKGGKYFTDKGEVIGFAHCVKFPSKVKSSGIKNLPEYPLHWLFLDECIPEDGPEIPNLYKKLTSIYISLARRRGMAFDNDLRIILAANNVSCYMSSFITKLGIDRYIGRSNKQILSPKEIPGTKIGTWVFEQTDSSQVEATKNYKASNGYRMADDLYREQAFSNRDGSKKDFIQKIKEPQEPSFNFFFDGKEYHVSYVPRKGIYYVDYGHSSADISYAFTLDDQSINTTLCLQFSRDLFLQAFRSRYEQGKVFFRSAQCKQAVDIFFRFIH